MKRVASLYLSSLPTDRLRRIDGWRRSATPPDRLLVTTQRSGQRMVVVAACPLARSLDLKPGMALTQARALVPELDIRPADPEADISFLTRLALLATRHWTPYAAVSEPDGLWLDLTGVSHLFGGERRMCERILRFCSRLGFDSRIAVAGTAGAAHALARFGNGQISLCRNGHEAEAIECLPPAALRLNGLAIAAARRFGIETIGELVTMPRGPLARRFGAELLTRLDQALGGCEEPLDPVIPEESPQASLRFLEPILTAEATERVLSDLVPLLVTKLEQQRLGVRQVLLICNRVDGEDQKLVMGTAGAIRDGPAATVPAERSTRPTRAAFESTSTETLRSTSKHLRQAGR